MAAALPRGRSVLEGGHVVGAATRRVWRPALPPYAREASPTMCLLHEQAWLVVKRADGVAHHHRWATAAFFSFPTSPRPERLRGVSLSCADRFSRTSCGRPPALGLRAAWPPRFPAVRRSSGESPPCPPCSGHIRGAATRRGQMRDRAGSRAVWGWDMCVPVGGRGRAHLLRSAERYGWRRSVRAASALANRAAG